MYKLGHYVDGAWREYSHGPEFSIELTASGEKKVLATAPGSDPLVFMTIVDLLTPPLFLLYVLHTPREGERAGRYQSGELDSADIRQFVERFSDFLSADGRFDIWAISPADNATVVWDRHNLIHAYGPTDLIVETLQGMGFYSGKPSIPAPHQHCYHGQLDEQARALLNSQPWYYSALQLEDEQ